MSSAPEREDGPEHRPSSATPPLRRAVFVDRDGTLNVDTHYLQGPEKVELHLGVREGVALLRAHGFLVVVVTNQSGISRGFYTREAVEAIHQKIQRLMAEAGTQIDAFYYCPHAPQEGCACRKPGTALFEQAARELHIDLRTSAIIGDRMLDVEAGTRLGLTTVYVPEPGAHHRYPQEFQRAQVEANLVATSFLAGCRRLLERG